MRVPRHQYSTSPQLPRFQAAQAPSPRMISVRNQKFVPQAHEDLLLASSEADFKMMQMAGELIGTGIDKFFEAKAETEFAAMKNDYLKQVTEFKTGMVTNTPLYTEKTDPITGKVEKVYPWKDAQADYTSAANRISQGVREGNSSRAQTAFNTWRAEVDLKMSESIAKWQADKMLDQHAVTFEDALASEVSVEGIDRLKNQQIAQGVMKRSAITKMAGEASVNLIETRMTSEVEKLRALNLSDADTEDRADDLKAIAASYLPYDWYSMEDYNRQINQIDGLLEEREDELEERQALNNILLKTELAKHADSPQTLRQFLKTEFMDDPEAARHRYGDDTVDFYMKMYIGTTRPTVNTSSGIRKLAEINRRRAFREISPLEYEREILQLTDTNAIAAGTALSQMGETDRLAARQAEERRKNALNWLSARMGWSLNWNEDGSMRYIFTGTAKQETINVFQASLSEIEDRIREEILQKGDLSSEDAIQIAREAVINRGYSEVAIENPFNMLWDENGKMVTTIEQSDYQRTKQELYRLLDRKPGTPTPSSYNLIVGGTEYELSEFSIKVYLDHWNQINGTTWSTGR